MTRISTVTQKPETASPDQLTDNSRRQTSTRGAEPVRLRTGVRLSYGTLRRWHADLEAALASPRAASTAKRLADMAADLSALLGPCADPDFVPERQLQAVGYEVTYPDGSERTFRTALEVARVLGVTPNSLKVMLSRNGGSYRRTYPIGSGVETWSVRRIYAASAPA